LTRADALRALCADLSAPLPAGGIAPDSLIGRWERDADLFERAGDSKTAAGIHGYVEALRSANAVIRARAALAVFLDDGASEAQRKAIQLALSQAPGVTSVVYWSKADALAHFKRAFAAFPDLTANVTADALPESFHLRLASSEAFDQVTALAMSMSGVSKAVADLSDVPPPAARLGAIDAIEQCRSPAPSLSP